MKTGKIFRIFAYVVTIFFALMILYPLLYILANSMKDSAKIYDVPPSIFPESAKSISIVLDYTDFKNQNEEEQRRQITQDHIITMIATINELSKDSLFEVEFYGTMDGRTIYYAREHRTRLDLEKDQGVYKGIAVTQNTLTHGKKIEDAAESLGYSFSMDGLADKVAPKTADTLELAVRAKKLLTEDFVLFGNYKGIAMHQNNWLLLESLVYYLKLPGFIYSNNAMISRFSFGIFFINTFIVLLWAILCQVILGAITAFPLSRLLPPKMANNLLLFFLGSTMIPFVAVMIPQFTMFKDMGLYNNYAAILLPHLLPYGFFVYLYKGFFDKLPESLFEAARIDGASDMYLFINICIPLSRPIIAVVALQTFLANWNDFFWTWMVAERQELWTLNVALYNISKISGVKPNFIMGLSVLTIIPVLLITILFSNQIKDSIASAGIKG